MDDLGLVEAVDGLGQGIVVAVANTADRRLDASFAQPLGISNGQVLRAAVTVMDKAHGLRRSPIVDRLLGGIQDETGLCRGAGAPADDLARISVDDESDIDEPLLGRDVGEIADPQHVGRRNPELAIHLVQRTRRFLVRDRCPVRLAADAHVVHQPCHLAPRHIEAFPKELPPDLADAVDAPVLFENTPDLEPQSSIATRTVR